MTKHLSKGYRLPTRAETPMSMNYSPEINVPPLLGSIDVSYYQFLIGVMRWMVEIECIDINTEVSILSSHVAMPK